MNFISRISELDDLYLSIQKVSGFTVEQLLNMFMAGYEMSAPKYEAISQLMPEDIGTEKKEATTMQVTYNGFTGELVKMEKKETGRYTVTPYDTEKHLVFEYDISIYDREKKATISFTGVKLEDVKFLGGAVAFGG